MGSWIRLVRPLWALQLVGAILCVGTAFADAPNVLWMRAGASAIGAIAYTADGSALVTESNNAIRIWRLSDGVLLKDIIVPGQYIGSVSLTPNGQYAAVSINPEGGAANDWSIALVRLSDSTVLSTIPISQVSPTGTYTNFVLSPDASLLAVGTASGQEGDSRGRVMVFDTATATAVNTFPAGGVTVPTCSSCSFYPLAFQGDGQLVAEGSNNGSGISVMYTAGTYSDGSAMTELTAASFSFLAASPNNQWVVLSFLYDFGVYPSGGCGGLVPPACPVPAGSGLIQAGDDGAFSQDSSQFALWSNPNSTSTMLSLFSTGGWSSGPSTTVNGSAEQIAFSPSGSAVADAYAQVDTNCATLEVRSTADLSVTQTLTQFAGPVGPVAFSHNSQMFATAGNIANASPAPPPFVKIWDANTGALLQTIAISCGGLAPPCEGGAVETLAFSPDDSSIFVGGIGGVVLYSIATGLATNTLIAGTGHAMLATESPDGTKFALPDIPTSAGGYIELHSSTDGSLLAASTFSDAWVLFPPLFAPDGNSLFAVTHGAPCSTYGVEQMSTSSFEQIQGFCSSLFQSFGINSIAVSPDGTLLAVGTNDNQSPATTGRVVVFHVSTGTQMETLVGNATSVASVAFSPDGQTIVAGDYDSNICIWRVVDGTLLETYNQETGANEFVTNPVGPLAFSSDGSKLGYARYDSVAVVAGNPVSATLTETASPTTYKSIGQTITYTYTIRNTGTATLAGPFSIADSKLGTITPCGTAPLAAGASTKCVATYKVVQADFNAGSITSTATASGLGVTSNQASTTVNAVTVQITIATNPSGLGVTVDEVSYTAPQTFIWPVHTTHTIDAPTVTIGATKETFVSWSDGGLESHKVTATVAATYTASFQTSYWLAAKAYPAATDGTVSGSGWYVAGSTATVTAAPNAGFLFLKFVGAVTGTTNPQSLVMNAPESVTAVFVVATPALTAAIVAKTTAKNPNNRIWSIRVTNRGDETATGAEITAAQIVVSNGPGSPLVLTSLPVNLGDIAVAASATAPIVLHFPVTSPATTIQLTLTLSANSGTYTTTAVFNNQAR